MTKLHSIFNGYDKSEYPIVTHNIHPYPAKYPPHIPGLILNHYANEGDVILDPFMGSGTTVVESNFLGYTSIGNDINPLSKWLVQIKTTKLTEQNILLIEEFQKDLAHYYQNKQEVPLPFWTNIDHWFKPHILYELSLIKWLIRQEKYIDLEWFLSICLSSIVVITSNQDNDIRYCTHKKVANDEEGYAIAQFNKKVKKYIQDNQKLNKTHTDYKIYNNNALELGDLEESSVDMIITSPPYANTNDYFLNHRLRLLLLDLDYDYYRKNEIGSHAQFCAKKADISAWNFDLLTMLQSFNRVLKQGKDAFIVIGDTVWKKDLYKVDKMIIDNCEESGFEFIDIYSYNLKDVSKSFNPLFANQLHTKQEHIIHIRKKS